MENTFANPFTSDRTSRKHDGLEHQNNEKDFEAVQLERLAASKNKSEQLHEKPKKITQTWQQCDEWICCASTTCESIIGTQLCVKIHI